MMGKWNSPQAAGNSQYCYAHHFLVGSSASLNRDISSLLLIRSLFFLVFFFDHFGGVNGEYLRNEMTRVIAASELNREEYFWNFPVPFAFSRIWNRTG